MGYIVKLMWDGNRRWGTIAAIILSLVMTTLNLVQTYQGYVGEAYSSIVPVFLYYVVNIVFTLVLIWALSYIIKSVDESNKYIYYAVVIAIALQSLIHTEINLTKVLAGAEESGILTEETTFNIGDLLYDRIVGLITASIDEKVTEAKVMDLRIFRQKFTDEEGLVALKAAITGVIIDARIYMDPEKLDEFSASYLIILNKEVADVNAKIGIIGVEVYLFFPRSVIQNLSPTGP